MKKMNSILLVDDSKSTNFYHRKLIEMCDVAEHVHEVYNGLEAITYLKNSEKNLNNRKSIFPKPDLIFLDINMPKMDGFEFLHEFEGLSESYRSNVLITFLTTSNWEKDKNKAYQSGNLIYDFIEKPLSKDMIKTIYQYYIDSLRFARDY